MLVRCEQRLTPLAEWDGGLAEPKAQGALASARCLAQLKTMQPKKSCLAYLKTIHQNQTAQPNSNHAPMKNKMLCPTQNHATKKSGDIPSRISDTSTLNLIHGRDPIHGLKRPPWPPSTPQRALYVVRLLAGGPLCLSTSSFTPQKYSRFDTSWYPVPLFVAEICYFFLFSQPIATVSHQ